MKMWISTTLLKENNHQEIYNNRHDNNHFEDNVKGKALNIFSHLDNIDTQQAKLFYINNGVVKPH